MLKAIIFDLDGVLVETEYQTFEFYRQYLKQFGIHLKDADFEKKFGKKSIDFFNSVLTKDQQKTINIPFLIEHKRKEFYKKISKFVKKVDGSNEVISELNKNFRLVVASQNEKIMIERILTWTKLKNYFDLVLSLQDIENKKPNPEIYNLALKRLKIKPKEALVIEDSEDGLRAAKAAKIPVVIIKHGFTKPKTVKIADFKITNIHQLIQLVKKLDKESR